jgi:hypothetical protein
MIGKAVGAPQDGGHFVAQPPAPHSPKMSLILHRGSIRFYQITHGLLTFHRGISYNWRHNPGYQCGGLYCPGSRRTPHTGRAVVPASCPAPVSLQSRRSTAYRPDHPINPNSSLNIPAPAGHRRFHIYLRQNPLYLYWRIMTPENSGRNAVRPFHTAAPSPGLLIRARKYLPGEWAIQQGLALYER